MVYYKSTNLFRWFTNKSTVHTRLDGLLSDLRTGLNSLLANLKTGLVGLLTDLHTGLNSLLQIRKPIYIVYYKSTNWFRSFTN